MSGGPCKDEGHGLPRQSAGGSGTRPYKGSQRQEGTVGGIIRPPGQVSSSSRAAASWASSVPVLYTSASRVRPVPMREVPLPVK